ncbi:MAG TPA: GNAT family N-acetyltransferase [Solirubrobacterales bacterium]|nr:GNAT family N-acetyltransferase [Solirubrobacterales bacterium]
MAEHAESLHTVRAAGVESIPAVARLLHQFNEEFGEPSPGARFLEERIRALAEAGKVEALICGERPDGFALVQFQETIWSVKPNCYLAELYVVPDRRGDGRGRALMDAVLEAAHGRGADHIDLNTSDDDRAARGLYESLGFTNREGSRDGPRMLYYERDL